MITSISVAQQLRCVALLAALWANRQTFKTPVDTIRTAQEFELYLRTGGRSN